MSQAKDAKVGRKEELKTKVTRKQARKERKPGK